MRGTLRLYLGAAPGVGKTYAMLNEGHRRRDRGADVVVGVVETHSRAQTAAQIGDLEIVPRRAIAYRDTELAEMDVDAILARDPDVCLVDELAHTNAPGSRNRKRWEDVEELLEAGIHVISTLNVQHLESLNDVVARITGVVQRETVPDAFVRRAEQIELVDMTPEALRRRMAHGNVYPASRVDAALANYFRPGNLGALRELTLLWVADRVEEALDAYVERHGIADTWEVRERVVVAITGVPGGDRLVRRAARMAGRLRGELVGVHVVASDGLAQRAGPDLERQRALVTELGGVYREVVADDVAAALVELARAERATQLVLGATRTPRWREALVGSIVQRVVQRAGQAGPQIDVHVIAADDAPAQPATAASWLPRLRSARPGSARPFATRLPRRRQVAGLLLAVTGLPTLTACLVGLRGELGLSTDLLLFLAFGVAVTAVGGRAVGLGTAVAASLLANWYLVEPLGTLTVADAENLVALAVFVTVATVVGTLVDVAARRARDVSRARTEAEALARTAAVLATHPDPVQALIEQLRATFGLAAAAVLSGHDPTWTVTASSGSPIPSRPEAGDAVDLGTASDGAQRYLVVVGPPSTADDRRILRVLADHLSVALEARRLHREVIDAAALAEVDVVRTALLQAVSHDLRTPLASIKANVSGLRAQDVTWTEEETAETLAAIETECDRLNRLVGNLLDASRLQSGAVAVDIRPFPVDDLVVGALGGLEAGADAVQVATPADLPLARGDAALLERALANVIANALRHRRDHAVRIEAGVVNDEVHLRVIDRGTGIPAEHHTAVLAPFQRLGDHSTTDGVGLGLAIARGFVEACAGRFLLEDTPGGGLTVTFALPVADTDTDGAPSSGEVRRC